MRSVSGATVTPANRSGLPEMLKQRVITAVVALGVLLVVVFLLPPLMAQLTIAALMLFAAWEWSAFLSPKGTPGRLAYVALVALAGGAFFWVLPDRFPFDILVRIAIGAWLAALVWIFFYPTPVPKLLAWAAGLLVLVPAWLAIDFLYMQHALLLLFMLSIVWAADIGAYFAGRFLGRLKLAPSVSPGKTWEGVIGGMLAVTILALAIGYRTGFDPAYLVPLCLSVAMLSVVGDLTVSMFKRSRDLKDSGGFFPGHGGILDRIDSVTAAAPLFVVGSGWAGFEL